MTISAHLHNHPNPGHHNPLIDGLLGLSNHLLLRALNISTWIHLIHQQTQISPWALRRACRRSVDLRTCQEQEEAEYHERHNLVQVAA